MTLIDYYRQQFPDAWNKHVLIVGIGGARTDFLTRWLSTMSEYFCPWPTRWIIDVETGSTINGSINPFDRSADILQAMMPAFVEYYSATYDPHAPKQNVSKCHHSLMDLDQIIPREWQDRFDIVHIKYDPLDIDVVAKITWEFVVKTYGRNLANFDQHGVELATLLDAKSKNPRSKVWTISSDQDRCDVFSEIITQLAKSIVDNEVSKELPAGSRFNYIPIEYKLLTRAGNSREIAQQLGLEVRDHYHDMFDRSISATHSPVTYRAFGKEWSLADTRETVKKCLEIFLEHGRYHPIPE